MEFGVDFNYWFYKLQKDIFAENNKATLNDPELYELYDKTWYSIDAYTICNPKVYEKLGFDYQQELITKVGGGLLHTHGTGLLELLPYISRLKSLGKMQIGRDLYHGEFLGLEILRDVREKTGDIPLTVGLGKDEFLSGIKNHTLPGGTEYQCSVDTIDEANRLADMAREYKL